MRAYSKTRLTSSLVATAIAAAMTFGLAPSAGAQSVEERCTFDATVEFTPGLTVVPGEAQTFTVNGTTGSGTFGDCTPEGTGTVSVGRVWTDPATDFQWQEPLGTGTGSCGNTNLEGYSISRLSGGEVTVARYTSNSAGVVAFVVAEIVEDVTLTAVDKQPGQDDTLELSSTRNVGSTVFSVYQATSQGGTCGIAGDPVRVVTVTGPQQRIGA